jgi:hypothetical protein
MLKGDSLDEWGTKLIKAASLILLAILLVKLILLELQSIKTLGLH